MIAMGKLDQESRRLVGRSLPVDVSTNSGMATATEEPGMKMFGVLIGLLERRT